MVSVEKMRKKNRENREVDDMPESNEKIKRFTIQGPDSLLVVEGNTMMDAKGKLSEVLEIIEHWDPIHPSDVSQKLIENLKSAEKEIKEIRKLSKLFPHVNNSERVEKAKELVSDGEHKFSFILPEFIEEDWFDASHGLRNARSKIYPFAAYKARIIINAHNADEIMKAIRNKKEIPKVSYMRL